MTAAGADGTAETLPVVTAVGLVEAGIPPAAVLQACSPRNKLTVGYTESISFSVGTLV